MCWEAVRVIHDYDTTFKVKGQLAGGGGILWQPPTQLVKLAKEIVIELFPKKTGDINYLWLCLSVA